MYTSLLHIDTDKQAEELIVEIKAERAERDRLNAVCQTQVDRYQAMIEENDMALENSTAQALSLLGVYCKEKATDKDKTETLTKYKLPSGQLVWKKQNKQQTIDKDNLLVWAKVYAKQFIKEKKDEIVEWGELKKRLVDAGNHYEMVDSFGELIIVHGVELVEPEQSEVFEVR